MTMEVHSKSNLILLNELSETQLVDICRGSLDSLELSASSVNVEIFRKMIEIAETYAPNRDQALLNMLCNINPMFESYIPGDMSNFARKYNRIIKKVVKEKADTSKREILEGEIISICSTWSMLEKYSDVEKLKDGVVECVDASGFEVTNEIFIKLGEFKQKYSALTWRSLTSWASEYFKIARPLEASVSSEFSRLIRERYKLRSNKLARATMLSQVYVFPVPKITECKLKMAMIRNSFLVKMMNRNILFPLKNLHANFQVALSAKYLH